MIEKAYIQEINKEEIYCIVSSASCMHCKNKLFCKKPEKPFLVKNPNNVNIETGDLVFLDLKSSKTVSAILLTFLFPLSSIIFSLIVASKFTQSALYQFLIATLALSLALLIVYIYNKVKGDNELPIIEGIATLE